jgi:hypothetical protein
VSAAASSQQVQQRLSTAKAGFEAHLKSEKAPTRIQLGANTDPLDFVRLAVSVESWATRHSLQQEQFRELISHIAGVTEGQVIANLAPADLAKPPTLETRQPMRPAWRRLWLSVDPFGNPLLSNRIAPTQKEPRKFVEFLFSYFDIIEGEVDYEALNASVAEWLSHPKVESKEFMKLRRVKTEAEWIAWFKENWESMKLAPQKQEIKRNSMPSSYIDAETSDLRELADEVPVLASIRMPIATAASCGVDAFLVATDGKRSSINAAVDSRAQVDCVSAARATRDGLVVDTSRRHRIAGATEAMKAESIGTTSIVLHTANGPIEMNDVVVIDGLAYEVIIGAPTMQRLRMSVSSSPSGFSIAWQRTEPVIAPVRVARQPILPTPQPTFRCASRIDELFEKIDFDAVQKVTGHAVSDKFRQLMRAEVSRLDQHRLIIGPDSPGHTLPDALRGASHSIKLDPAADTRSVNAPWRRMRADEFAALRAHTDALEQAGILRRLGHGEQSYVNNPIIVVDKKDEHGNVVGKRIVHDARALNAVTLVDRYALPLVRDVLNFASSGELHSKIDLANWFMQFPLERNSQWLTATKVSDYVTVVATRMLPGLHSAGATAQRFADHVFKNDDTMPYLDDLTSRHQIGAVSDATAAREIEQRLLAWFRRFVDQCIRFTANAKKSHIFCIESTILDTRHRQEGGRVPRVSVVSFRASERRTRPTNSDACAIRHVPPRLGAAADSTHRRDGRVRHHRRRDWLVGALQVEEQVERRRDRSPSSCLRNHRLGAAYRPIRPRARVRERCHGQVRQHERLHADARLAAQSAQQRRRRTRRRPSEEANPETVPQ